MDDVLLVRVIERASHLTEDRLRGGEGYLSLVLITDSSERPSTNFMTK